MFWILAPELSHGVGVSAVEWGAILRLRVGVARRERFDQPALQRRTRRGVLSRQHQFLPGQFRLRRRDEGKVDVRTARQGDAPVRHRTFRIKAGRFLERSDRHAVIETEQEAQPLIEIALRPG
jgi:hypothetical protein